MLRQYSGLLDLYQKEKEKNKLLINNKFREVADKNSYVKDNYIAKSKIKAKIEELNEILKSNLHITFERYGAPEQCLIYGIKILQELLEEED